MSTEPERRARTNRVASRLALKLAAARDPVAVVVVAGTVIVLRRIARRRKRSG